MSNAPTFYTQTSTGLILAIKAKPGTSHKRAPKIVDLANDKKALEIAVNAPPEDGKANKAILDTLADELGLKKKDVALKTGTTNKLKLVEIIGDPQDLQARLQKWIAP